MTVPRIMDRPLPVLTSCHGMGRVPIYTRMKAVRKTMPANVKALHGAVLPRS